MGLIARVLSFTRVTRNGAQVSDTKANPGGGPNLTAEHFASPGDDSHPLTMDYVYLSPAPQRGRYSAVGYVDPLNQPQAQAGEKRIYGRNAEGSVIVQFWLKNDGEALLSNDSGSVTLNPDGSILGSNSAGSFELQIDGDFVVNGVTIDPSGNISTPGTIEGDGITDTANSVTLSTHDHGGSPPTPGS